MNSNEMSPSEREKILQAAGMCNFMFLFILSTTAMALTFASAGYCAFVSRDIVANQDVLDSYCENKTYDDQEQCFSYFDNHGVGFWGWQATIPQNQIVCLSYTQYIPGKVQSFVLA